jgi:hypothetical protein
MWEARRLTTLWASTACYRDSFTSTGIIWQLVLSACLLTIETSFRVWMATLGSQLHSSMNDAKTSWEIMKLIRELNSDLDSDQQWYDAVHIARHRKLLSLHFVLRWAFIKSFRITVVDIRVHFSCSCDFFFDEPALRKSRVEFKLPMDHYYV